jgi:rod shape-determining protein MreD
MTTLFIGLMVLLDLFISSFISSDFSWQSVDFVPMLSLLFLVFVIIDQPTNKHFVYAFFTGLIVDLMTHSMLFTHAIVYVIVLIIMREFQRHFSTSLFEIIVMGMVAIFLKETLLLVWYTLIEQIDISLLQWYTSRLLVTLLGNIPLMFFAYYIATIYEKRVKKNIKKQQQSETTLWGFLKD